MAKSTPSAITSSSQSAVFLSSSLLVFFSFAHGST